MKKRENTSRYERTKHGLVFDADKYHLKGTFIILHLLKLVGSKKNYINLCVTFKICRMLAPQTSENPIYFHTTTKNSTAFRKVRLPTALIKSFFVFKPNTSITVLNS